ncbi:MAG: acylphosphatase, partial [Planctomycetales bacterium]
MSHHPSVDSQERIARRLILAGGVQGLGVRPAIARLAAECQVTGSVANRRDGVEIVLEGLLHRVRQFQRLLPRSLPRGVSLEQIEESAQPVTGSTEFLIDAAPADGPLRTLAPRDLAVCETCLREVATPGNRRADYPLISCTDCGPRYTIIEAMPYERS